MKPKEKMKLIKVEWLYNTIPLNQNKGFDVDLINKQGALGWRYVKILGFDIAAKYLFEKRLESYL